MKLLKSCLFLSLTLVILVGCSSKVEMFETSIDRIDEDQLIVNCSNEVNRNKTGDINAIGYLCNLLVSESTNMRDIDGSELSMDDLNIGDRIHITLVKPIDISDTNRSFEASEIRRTLIRFNTEEPINDASDADPNDGLATDGLVNDDPDRDQLTNDDPNDVPENDELEYEPKLLASIEDREIYLYSRYEFNGVTLLMENNTYEFDWVYMTPRQILPEMSIYDYDQDGHEEIAVSVNIGSGTGVAIDDLHILEFDGDQVTDHLYLADDYLSQLRDEVEFRVVDQEVEPRTGILTVSGQSFEVDLSNLSIEDLGTIYEELFFRDIVSFEFIDDDIQAVFGVGALTEGAGIPIYVGDLVADVIYDQGTFRLGEMRYEESYQPATDERLMDY